MNETNWGPNGRQVYERTYRRTMENGQPEQWHDTVVRVVDGNLGLVDPKHHEKDERNKLIELFYNFKALPAGRHLWMSGVPGRQFLFNCHHAGWDETDVTSHFSFTFDQLMQGGGVGANYSNEFVKHYDPVKHSVDVHIVCDPDHPDYYDLISMGVLSSDYSYEWGGATRVQDSREGWSDALATLLGAFWNGVEVLVLDVSLVRHKGAKIKTFGGTAAGPMPLAKLLTQTAKLLSDRVGQKISSLDAMLIDHWIGECVVSGNVRRSARMSIKNWADPDIFDFINCKADSGEHWSTNISIEVNDEFFKALKRGDEHARAVYRAAMTGMLTNGEPGFYNRSLAEVGEVNPVPSTNPCVVGETKIATADGRGAVPIAQLAEEGEDIPVYSFNRATNAIEVQTGVNPRVTGYDMPIVEVKLGNGTSFKVTPNHRFLMLNGEYKEAKDLVKGDSLRPLSRWSGKYTDTKNRYWFMEAGRNTKRGEHVLIGEWLNGGSMDGKVVHHKDFQGLNNHLSNLQVMTPQEHTDYHASISTGENNPMWGRENKWGHHSEEAKRKIGDAHRGRKLTEAQRIALSATAKARAMPPVEKNCEICGNHFTVPYARREQMMCSVSCSNVYSHRNGKVARQVATRDQSREGKRVKQLEVYNDLDIELGRPPLKSEWTEACKSRGIPSRIGQGPEGHNPTFYTFSELKDAAAMVNHRVVAVVDAGRADVYNMTVERNHNLALVTEVESRKTPGKMNLSGVFTAQCGEIALEEFENCNLGHVNLDAFYNDFEGAIEAHRLMTRYLIRATFGDVPNDRQREVLERNRRIGVGHFGFHGWLVKQDIRFSDSHRDPYVRKTLRDFYNAVRKEARRYAFHLRVPEPIKVTTIAPTGTISKLAGRSEGIHPILFKYYINRVRFSTVDPGQILQLEEFEREGYDIEDDMYTPNTKVVSFIAKNGLLDEVAALGYDADYLIEAAADIPLADMLAVQAMYQEYYADNAVSFTVNVKPHESQIQHIQDQTDAGVSVWSIQMIAPPEKVIDESLKTLIHYLPYLKGTTLMVDGSRPQSPYESLTKEQYEMYHLVTVGDGIDENCMIGACPIK